MFIRQETHSFAEIYELVKTAFLTAKVSNGKEQDFVNQLRAGNGYICRVGVGRRGRPKKIVGHIMLTKTYVAIRSGGRVEALLLAPLSVALEYRNHGVGSALIKCSLESAKKLGFRAVFVVGDPAYYGRFSFKPSAVYGIRHVPEIPSQYVMALELLAGALAGVNVTVTRLANLPAV